MGDILRVDTSTPEFMSQRRFQTVAAQAIDRQAAAIQQTREFMADLSGRVDTALGQIARLDDVRCRSFLGRCRWLFLGR